MEIEVVGDDGYGTEAYKALFDEIMSDLNKAVLIDDARLVLRPADPLFIFTIVLKAAPGAKTIGDVSTVRTDVGGVHLTITEERYAPDILEALFAKYGRMSVVQQTRFDLDVSNAKESDVSSIVISSGEEDKREIMGAIWRTMPEGIKNRMTLMSGNVITVIATEEILEPEMVEIGRKEHVSKGGSKDVRGSDVRRWRVPLRRALRGD